MICSFYDNCTLCSFWQLHLVCSFVMFDNCTSWFKFHYDRCTSYAFCNGFMHLLWQLHIKVLIIVVYVPFMIDAYYGLCFIVLCIVFVMTISRISRISNSKNNLIYSFIQSNITITLTFKWSHTKVTLKLICYIPNRQLHLILDSNKQHPWND